MVIHQCQCLIRSDQNLGYIMKDCGECNWCCFFPAGKGLNKPRNSWCKHCEVGVGCAIYDDRPESCLTYQCVWLQDQVMPDDLRPDRCGVMFEIPHGMNTIAGLVDPDRPNAWKAKRVRQLIGKFQEAGYPVLIRT